ncbi:Extracellular ligand-binding receptor domain and GPCR, family 3, gamma-aminobutyric acid receptor, type B and GPCR, family 3, gamma-aminobutyric acid receptor, type B1 and GPCR, family 3, C-terminal domain and Periplasmic binding protein-like I domain-containing protein [Strongyloides ratti]|uniref:Gamma-aminobutyric acid type B receptor subunit 2 n=1 Tax=Strongyloides ratti TaxID=34506 RepID=A0A090MPT5_STRRB|nr:Extracellular ligand-binding receptor domain and GPCR, family 3, gamma-aminobutyric acid receptor, type B and GPCR, family 3, gamma-aminobutyric acid receptor, type B1 and GPCR, family 3, C-terminal domain and Periplasmic binding protein-like I domain-containing protein [Strongyloides ratti]CEF60147.1 Extracellular ligand-binding receptor domain and GPCR, family 3, gamma-aminobutyric acid receptor, type B and GPCR, family 3, gamma-aminobutyric acid receptor, type B1 and GPCR, family 3, C-termin
MFIKETFFIILFVIIQSSIYTYSFSFFSNYKKCRYSNDSNSRESLSLGVFLPQYYRKQIEPAIELALRHAHNTPNVIPDYCLNLIFKDTECKTSLGMKALFDLMSRNTKPVAVFGDVCTNVNEPVAMTSGHWDLLHLSYAETHSKFATADANELYPTFFRMVPGDRNVIAAKCQMILHHNWRRVGTIKQADDARFSLAHESLTTKLENNYGIRVVYTAGLNLDELEKVSSELDELKSRDARIIIGDFDRHLAIKILCEAYLKEMYGNNYVWILAGYHNETWWDVTFEDSNCTKEHILKVLDGHFSIQFAMDRYDKKTKLVSGLTAKQTENELQKVCKNVCKNNIYSKYAYDGIWTLVFALNKTLENEIDASIEFDRDTFLSSLHKSRFEGLTGKVGFENHERLGIINIYQFLNKSYHMFGYYDGIDDKLNILNITKKYNWIVPQDATIVVRERQYVSKILIWIMNIISIVGICIALIFLAINIRYRNHRFIKMSSPNMNNLIIFGSILAYISVILLGVDTRMVSSDNLVPFCHAKVWVLCIGFTLAFGSMFSKTWRVHSIFTNIQWNKKAIKDYKLFLIVACILAIDIVILGIWAFLSPFSFKIIDQPKILLNNLAIVPELEVCQSNNSLIFQLSLYGIKGLLMILGCFLAWETRHVNVPALNDSKYIGMSVYNIVVMSVLGVSLAVLLKEKVDEAYALSSFFIIFCTTLTLFFVFVPKIVELARHNNDQDTKVYRKGMLKSVTNKKSEQFINTLKKNNNVVETNKQKIERIEKENFELKNKLKELSLELWSLIEELKKQNFCSLHGSYDEKKLVFLYNEGEEETKQLLESSNSFVYDISLRKEATILSHKGDNVKTKLLSDEENSLEKYSNKIKANSKDENAVKDFLPVNEANISPQKIPLTSNVNLSPKKDNCENSWPWLDPTQHITML